MIDGNSLHFEEEPNPQTLSPEILMKNQNISVNQTKKNNDIKKENEETIQQLPLTQENPINNQNVSEDTIQITQSSILINNNEIPEAQNEDKEPEPNLDINLPNHIPNQVDNGTNENNQNININNHINNHNNVQTTKNNTINHTNISLSLEQMYKNVLNVSKTQNGHLNQFDVQKLSYEYLKEMSKIKISKDESFMIRMIFDILKRQSQEKKLNVLLEQSKVKLDEDERIKGFNRLIEDANRRLEAQEHLEILKKKLEEEVELKPAKKYKNDQWKEIYNERFMRYQEEKDKKLTKLIKEKKEKERLKEEEEIKLCKTKKAPINVIEQYGKRLYEESLKRKMKNNKNGKNKTDNKSVRKEEDEEKKNEEKLKQTLDYILQEDEDDVRSVPKPISNSKNVSETSTNKKGKNNILKKQSTIPKLNPSDFIPRGNSCIHIEESKADKIVNEFFIKNLRQKK